MKLKQSDRYTLQMNYIPKKESFEPSNRMFYYGSVYQTNIDRCVAELARYILKFSIGQE